ncbi:MAG: CheR family methyltransferase [Myxococcota bacterium]
MDHARNSPARLELERRLLEWTGIDLSRGGVRRSLAHFLERRLRELGIERVEDYLNRVGSDAAELERLVNATTVVYTWFLRDEGQLSAIAQVLQQRSAEAPALRVWVPGCATGEDAYSLALLAARLGKPIFVLGTDVNSEALVHARAGAYGAFSVKELKDLAHGYFTQKGSSWVVGDALRSSVRFARHNLVDSPPIAPGDQLWDVILCRNVLIYFAREPARRAFERMARALAPGGYLVLGASEVVMEVPPGLESTYRGERLLLRRTDPGRAREQTVPRVSVGQPTPAKLQLRVGPMPAVPQHAAEIAAANPPSAPTDSELRRLLRHGHTMLDRGDTHAASKYYQQAVAHDAACAEARLYAGITHYLCGNIELALNELRAAGFLDSRSWMASFYSALCHESLGHSEDAVREYRNVLRLADTAHKLDTSSVLGTWQRDLFSLARQRLAGSPGSRHP